ncbi:MAG TPA: hypothetical protein VMJ32_08185 [Pirellulales bacterium]|nr:hypothetical protein [Pirellulales bacterium]
MSSESTEDHELTPGITLKALLETVGVISVIVGGLMIAAGCFTSSKELLIPGSILISGSLIALAIWKRSP